MNDHQPPPAGTCSHSLGPRVRRNGTVGLLCFFWLHFSLTVILVGLGILGSEGTVCRQSHYIGSIKMNLTKWISFGVTVVDNNNDDDVHRSKVIKVYCSESIFAALLFKSI